MAIMIPQSLPAKASEGEKRFFQVLVKKLPDDFIVRYEPRIDGRYPDFIIVDPQFGVLIVEVKGWYPKQILKANNDKFEINKKGEDFESIERQKSPLRQAKDYLDRLLNTLKKYRVLTQQAGRYQGHLAFPIGSGVIMSNITEEQADSYKIRSLLPQPQVAYRNELLDWEEEIFTPEELRERLSGMFSVRFPFQTLTPDQISTIQAVIHPEIIVRAEAASVASVAGGFSPLPGDVILKTLDTRQETLAKKIGEGHRVFFGVSGSGKTLLLIARAKILINQNPNAKILVICFNVCLASSLRSVLNSYPENPQYKKIEVTHFHDWASSILGGLPSSVSGNFDEIVGDRVLERLSDYTEEQKWDAILIDEAHTFVSVWFQCCVKALKGGENGDLMIVADGSQSLYKRTGFRWKDVGVQAQGRTISKNFDLDRNYRNTQEILAAAWRLLSEAVEQHEILEDDEVTFPTVQPSAALRRGDLPKIYITSTPGEQETAVIKIVRELQKQGIDSTDIAILYRQASKTEEQQLKTLMEELNKVGIPSYWVTKNKKTKENYSRNKEGVKILTCLSSLGLEFKAVLILWLEQFDDCTANKESALLATRQLYVAMTRTQEALYFFSSPQAKLLGKIRQSPCFNVEE